MRRPLFGTSLLIALVLQSGCNPANGLPATAEKTTKSASPSAPTVASDLGAILAAPADLGLWVWHREDICELAARARLLEFCKTRGVTRLLVQVGFEAGGTRLADAEAFAQFNTLAHAAGIAVEALDGAPEMGYADERAATLAKLDAVLAFQRAQQPEARFVGVHYDIEPYTSARWKAGDTDAIMREMLETKAAILAAVRAADPRLTVGYDIPWWYDRHPYTYSVEFAGARKNFHQHIQDLSDNIGIMSYRRTATGENSITALCREELDYARATGKRVYPAIETIRLDEEPTITFHGRPPADFLATARAVHAHLADAPAYGGIFIHQYRSVRDLLEPAANEAHASATAATKY